MRSVKSSPTGPSENIIASSQYGRSRRYEKCKYGRHTTVSDNVPKLKRLKFPRRLKISMPSSSFFSSPFLSVFLWAGKSNTYWNSRPSVQKKRYDYTTGVDLKVLDWRASKLDESLIHIPSRKKTITPPVCLDCLSLSTRPCSFNKLQLIVINCLDLLFLIPLYYLKGSLPVNK